MKKQIFGFILGIAVVGLLAMAPKPFNMMEDKDYSLARVERKSGKYIFLNCEPVNDYEMTFTVQLPALTTTTQIDTPDKLTSAVLNRAFKISEKENKEFDALVIKDGQTKDLAIKFKK